MWARQPRRVNLALNDLRRPGASNSPDLESGAVGTASCPHKLAAVHFHCLKNAYITGFGWTCADEGETFSIKFSMYLGDDKIVDEHIIDLSG